MKTFCSDFTIKVPVAPFSLTTHGKLVGIHASTPKEAKTKLVSPDTHEPVMQFYVPESATVGDSVPSDKMFVRGECESAVILKDQATGETSITVLPKEELEAATETDLPKNIMNVTVHSPMEADKMMFPLKDHQSYVFYPATKDPDDAENYLAILALLKRGLAMCSVVNVQNHEGLYRLGVWRDRIILVAQAYPENLNPHKPPAEDEFVADPATDFIDALVERLQDDMTAIDPDTYRDRILAAKMDLTSGANGDEPELKKVEPKPKASALSELAAFLAKEGK